VRDDAGTAQPPAQRPEDVLRRLPESWRLPELPAPVAWQGTTAADAEPHEPTFEWVGESLRHAGTVVHAFVQRMVHFMPSRAASRLRVHVQAVDRIVEHYF